MTSPAKPWVSLLAPALVAAVGVGVLVQHQSHNTASTKVLGLSIKPAAAGGNGGGNNGNGNGNGSNPPSKNFVITGAVTGLAPGVTKQLALRLNNQNNQAIQVQSVTATASGGTTGCPNSMLLLGPSATPGSGSMSLSLTIQANSSTTTATDPLFPVKLSPSAPNACKSLTFTLTYGGSAVKG